MTFPGDGSAAFEERRARAPKKPSPWHSAGTLAAFCVSSVAVLGVALIIGTAIVLPRLPSTFEVLYGGTRRGDVSLPASPQSILVIEAVIFVLIALFALVTSLVSVVAPKAGPGFALLAPLPAAWLAPIMGLSVLAAAGLYPQNDLAIASLALLFFIMTLAVPIPVGIVLKRLRDRRE